MIAMKSWQQLRRTAPIVVFVSVFVVVVFKSTINRTGFDLNFYGFEKAGGPEELVGEGKFQTNVEVTCSQWLIFSSKMKVLG